MFDTASAARPSFRTAEKQAITVECDNYEIWFMDSICVGLLTWKSRMSSQRFGCQVLFGQVTNGCQHKIMQQQVLFDQGNVWCPCEITALRSH